MKQFKRVTVLVLAFVLCVEMFTVQSYASPAVRELSNVEVLQMSEADISYDALQRWIFVGQNNFEEPDGTKAVGLNVCQIWGSVDGTLLTMNFITEATVTASTLGVRDVHLQKKTGLFWQDVATSVGGSTTNTMKYSGTTSYANAVSGTTYRLSCEHYAIISGATYTEDNVSYPFVYYPN